MKLSELNELMLLEWWAQDVTKSMKEKGTVGSFTKQCREMGFQKSSYACIRYVEQEFEKIKKQFEVGEISKEVYDSWVLKKKRATLARVFKGWAKKK